MSSWLKIPAGSHFSLRNLPFGIISTKGDSQKRAGVAIGNQVLDLKQFSALGGFAPLGFKETNVFSEPSLNSFAALGQQVHRQVREYLQEVFTQGGKYADILENNQQAQQQAVVPVESVQNHLPMCIGDYTDFYVGLNHAYNCGVLFRGPENALQPNYYHLPVGYHGRASSVVPSGTDFHRPCGQILENPSVKEPSFAPCKRLDYELEMAAFVCTPNNLGQRVDVNEAENHIFGYVLMNDWSARDIQAWEYVPLGPFTAKNFGTSISPWVVLHDALKPFKAAPLDRPADKKVLPYLQERDTNSVFNINLEVELKTKQGDVEVLSTGTSSKMLFSFPQMIAHHTVTGCNLNTGDLIASGTISGEDNNSFGSMLEKSKGGKEKFKVGNSERTFIEDGDTIVMRAVAKGGDGCVGFGEVTGTILPPLN
jgi:fumarylacetoacetase